MPINYSSRRGDEAEGLDFARKSASLPRRLRMLRLSYFAMLPFATRTTAPAARTYPLTCQTLGNGFVMPNLSNDATTEIKTVMHVIVVTSPPLLYALTKK